MSGTQPLERGRDSHQQVTDAAAILRRKWQPLVLYQLGKDPMRFSELKETIDGISGKVLSENLQRLEQHGLVDRTVKSDRPVRVEYSLTGRGEDFMCVIDELEKWAETYAPR